MLFIAYAFVALFGIKGILIADDEPPCLPDCDNSQWIPAWPGNPLWVDVQLCDKTFHVAYRSRFACNLYYDYYIEVVCGDESGDVRNCITQEYGDIGTFLQAAIEQLLIINPANFPPTQDGDCEPNWRVMKGSCWYLDWFDDVPKHEETQSISYGYPEWITPCTTNDCCLEFFKVCQNNGVREITQTGYLPPEDPTCENTYPGTNPFECQPVCGSVYNR